MKPGDMMFRHVRGRALKGRSPATYIIVLMSALLIDNINFSAPLLHQRELRCVNRAARGACTDVLMPDIKSRIMEVQTSLASEVLFEDIVEQITPLGEENKLEAVRCIVQCAARDIWKDACVELVGSQDRRVATHESDVDLDIKMTDTLNDTAWGMLAQRLCEYRVTDVSQNSSNKCISGYILGKRVDVANEQWFTPLERYPTLMSEKNHRCATRADSTCLLNKFYLEYPPARNCVKVLKVIFPSLPGIVVEGVVKCIGRSRADGWGGYNADASGLELFKEVLSEFCMFSNKADSPLQSALKDSRGVNTAECNKMSEALHESARIAKIIVSGPIAGVNERKFGPDAEDRRHETRIFAYVTWAGRNIICRGIQRTWEELKAQSREKRTSGGVDTQLPDVQQARYYKTQGVGPELFAVDGNAVFYHDKDKWHQYRSAVLLPLQAP